MHMSVERHDNVTDICSSFNFAAGLDLRDLLLLAWQVAKAKTKLGR